MGNSQSLLFFYAPFIRRCYNKPFEYGGGIDLIVFVLRAFLVSLTAQK
ncbi:hypothetical protein SAMN06265379_104119 [Saccharicrinis carchari]|uniref:Uncharacterized protein n=1 Tax=Saccharicrinis carchari TaxID=1168039 RepID=A0A521D3E9_SACCC|nr:hypothetical protein SAMN06265379_104119 [Saccharicrinis carchari]